MEKSNFTEHFEDCILDILGQTERINRLYTQITLCFPISNGSPTLRKEIIGTLERGLMQLENEFPWIAGHVIQEENIFRIKTLETAPKLVVRELQDDGTVLTWDELKGERFPFRMLDEADFAPCKTMVESTSERPVLLVQVNFVKGGVFLTFNAQHGSMDMAGQGQVITLFAKACRGENFTDSELEIGNMRRTSRIPLPDIKGPDDSESQDSRPEEVGQDMEASEATRNASITAPSSDIEWAYLEFPAASLASLKTLASQNLTADAAFISTDDVLSAFIWQSITRARQPRLDSPQSTPTTLTRNVDVRHHFDLPPTYPGLMTTATWHFSSVDDLVHQRSLGAVASDLRAALNPDNLKYHAQLQARTISQDKKTAAQRSVAALSNPSFDVRLSSWAKEKMYDLDFGPCLGRPEAVRRPRFLEGAREGLVYFLPKSRDGSIVVGICLREDDMKRMRLDGEVGRWSRWIG